MKKFGHQDYVLQDAIRTVGHLLVHRPTRYIEAQNDKAEYVPYFDPTACRWCLQGAVKLVALKFEIPNNRLWESIKETVPGRRSLARFWDSATELSQKRFATRLTRYNV